MQLFRLATVILGILAVPAVIASESLPLMPYPQQITHNASSPGVVLTAGFRVELAPESESGERLKKAMADTERRFFKQTGLPRVLQEGSAAIQADRLVLQVQVSSVVKPWRGEFVDESYSLKVGPEHIVLKANTDIGAIRGLETFLQLVQMRSDDAVLPAISIDDAPQFSWRGLMIDSARHFIHTDTIKRLLHTMASAKLNVFHWHLADDQGWRLPIDDYPALHERASDNLFYSHEEVRDVVTLADQLGIRVVPELDFPGHASAIGVAYPQLMSSARDYTMERNWGVHTPLLDPTNPQTYAFINAAVAQLTRLFPDPYIHIGGDEVNSTDWLNNPRIKAFMTANGLEDGAALQAYFNQRVNGIVNQHQRKMIGWDEVAHPQLPRDVVIQSWRGHDSIVENAADNRPVILSTGFYVDQPQYSTYHWQNAVVPVSTSLPALQDPVHLEIALTRLRGSPVEAVITLSKGSEAGQGYIDFKGRSRQVLEVSYFNGDVVRARTDTWMGPVEFRLHINNEQVSGYAVVGNASLAVSGNTVASIAPNAERPTLNAQQQQFIKGAEATLWTENVTDMVVDMRLWPRMYAIAEQMWGTADAQPAEHFYSRLGAIEQWSALSVGSLHREQQLQALYRALGSTVSDAEVAISRLLEPAHYYHRHHIKSSAGNYDVFEPLNKLADALAVESTQVIAFNALLEQWLAQPSAQTLRQLRLTLARWQADLNVVLYTEDSRLMPHAERLKQQIDYINLLLDKLATNSLINAETLAQIKADIAFMRVPQSEIISALVMPLETLYFYAEAKRDES